MKKTTRTVSIVTSLAALMIGIMSAGFAEAGSPLLWPFQDGQSMEFVVQSPSEPNPWKAQLKVTGTKTVGGLQYFRVEIPDWGQGATETTFLRSSEKGVYRLKTQGECTVAELDQSGTTFRCRAGIDGWEVTTFLGQTILTVPAGTFTKTYLFRKHIERNNGSLSPDWDVYIVPGVGLVKQVEYDGNYREGQSAPGIARVIELVRITPLSKGSAEGTETMPITSAETAAEPSANRTERKGRRVATFGTIVEIQASSFILKQESLRLSHGHKAVAPFSEHRLPIGYTGNHLEVLMDDATQISLAGASTSLSALSPGTVVVVAGMADGERLRAVVVSDLSHVGPPSEELYQSIMQSRDSKLSVPAEPPAAHGELPADTLSLCMGQDMDYDTDPYIKEFQGCYGGPSASGNFPGYHIPIACPLVGCWTLDYITYTYALGGWGFDFPYQFSASSAGLIYHVPSSLSLDLQSLEATERDFTFWGGLGFNFGLNIDFSTLCFPDFWNICHYDVGTVNISEFSMIHEATGPAPMPGETLDIEESACPGIGIEIPETPIELLTLEVCEDLSLQGVPFNTRVTAKGNTTLASSYIDFDGSSKTLSLTPDSLSVHLTFDDFWWVPDISAGIYLQLVFLGQLPFFSTPTIPIVSGPFMAITAPFPYPDSLMTVATDPLSPVDDLRYLYQPTEVMMWFAVDPAPTRLTIISSNILAEGEPVEALLQEDYTDAPIAGETVVFDVGSKTVSATTDASGIARVKLPVGEYTLNASFAGSTYYLSSSASQSPLYVYRPTQFVLWGGNAGGVQVGHRYMFWGNDWWKEVTAGDFDANAKFKGYAKEVSDTMWWGRPGNSGHPPKTVPSYIGVIVTTQVAKQGSDVTGNIAKRVILKVEKPSAYRPNPGHPGWGLMKVEIP